MSIRLRHGLLLSVPLALGIGALPAAAGQPDATDESVAIDAMLVADDVPWQGDPSGVTLETDPSVIDLPGYVENGGLRQVAQQWFSDETFAIVFDFRFQFPDAASAGAFLDASEEVLGEVASGAESQVPPVSPLEDTRYYRYEDKVLGTSTVGHNFLMRHENLVAKVYVSGAEMSEDVASGIAQAAAGRMKGAVGDDPGESPVPSGSDDVSIDQLLTHVPSGIRASCEPESPSVGVVSVSCSQSDELIVGYTLFESIEAMDEWFDLTRLLVQANGADTAGDDCSTGPYDGTWTLGSEEAGRLLCFDADTNRAIVWSHPASLTVSRIDHSGGDKAAAWDLWLAAGPE